MKYEILLAEDERILAITLSRFLVEHDYEVRIAKNGKQAVEAVRTRRPDLVLMDIDMPIMNGIEACRKIREADASLPIVFLTHFDNLEREIAALKSGGDLYVRKDEPEEILLARIEAILRPRSDEEVSGETFKFGAWTIDPNMMRADNGSKHCELTEREIYLLRLFVTNPGEVFTRDSLFSRLWPGSEDFDPLDGTLTQIIYVLRRKLGSSGDAISVVRGIGYVYRPK